MSLLTLEEFKLFENLMNLSQKNLRNVMSEHLKNLYGENNVIATDSFIYAIGTTPIGLLAHMDTVFENERVSITKNKAGEVLSRTNHQVCMMYDQWKEMLHCINFGGFDDRAGIYAIIRILEAGFRPSVILTTDEEIGGIGAMNLSKVIDKPLSELKYLIQLDRRGTVDCVFYDLDSKEFETYVESFGFKTAQGSFTDICTICPTWGIAGVNLSIGYENEHTLHETLNVKAWLDTIEKVKYMLSEIEIPFFEYRSIPTYYPYTYNYSYAAWDDYYDDYYPQSDGLCSCCNKIYNVFQLIPETDIDGKIKHYCADCYEKLESCQKCGALFYQKKPGWKYCKKCAKEVLNGTNRNNSKPSK